MEPKEISVFKGYMGGYKQKILACPINSGEVEFMIFAREWWTITSKIFKCGNWRQGSSDGLGENGKNYGPGWVSVQIKNCRNDDNWAN